MSIIRPAVTGRSLSLRTVGIEINSTMWGMRVGIFQSTGASDSWAVGMKLAVSVMGGCVLVKTCFNGTSLVKTELLMSLVEAEYTLSSSMSCPSSEPL